MIREKSILAAAMLATMATSGCPSGELDWQCHADKPCPKGNLCVRPQDLPDASTEQATDPMCYAICSSSAQCPGGNRACLGELCVLFDDDCSNKECPEGFFCNTAAHCEKYPATAACDNSVRDGSETDVDCGGSCTPCPNGKTCVQDADCEAGNTCDEGACNRCGDGTARADQGEAHSEQCDDGNTELEECDYPRQSCTVCGPTCKEEGGIPNFCGDGNIDTGEGETCDDGADNSNDWQVPRHCKADCSALAPYCGDGEVDADHEQCEPDLSDCPPGEGCGGCQCVDLPPDAPALELDGLVFKTLRFTWASVPFANTYNLYEDSDGSGNYTLIVPGMTATSYEHAVPVHLRAAAQYRLEACNDAGCTSSEALVVGPGLVQAIGYFKASNTGADDNFGRSVSLSSDGTTLAVGAYVENSNATGVGGNQDDNSAKSSGAVYVYVRGGSTVAQQAYVKASNTEASDYFGGSVALSSDGSTLAVGATGEASNATGVGGNQDDNSASTSGAVYVFTRSGSTWAQQAYVKASNTEAYDFFGYSVALSSDGNTLAVGAYVEKSNATGIDGDQDDNSAQYSGAVYVYTRSGSSWDQQAYVKASNTEASDCFGYSVALSSDGNTLAVGAYGEDSNATGVGGNQDENSAESSGAVYVFSRSGSTWAQQAYVKASNTEAGDRFGFPVALSSDGNTLAVGATGERSSAKGIDGNQNDNSAVSSGAVYVFTRSGSTWDQQAYVKASNTEAHDGFGGSVALSSDGNTLAVGAGGESSSAKGVGGNQDDNSAENSGAVYVFARSGSSWVQRAGSYVKASNTGAGDHVRTVALSSDGNTLAVGAEFESSNATGVGGDQDDNSAQSSGAVYVY